MPGLIRRISTKLSKTKPVSSALDTARSLHHSRSQSFNNHASTPQNPSYSHSHSPSASSSHDDAPIYTHYTSSRSPRHDPTYGPGRSPSPSLDNPLYEPDLISEESDPDDDDDDEVQIATASAVPMRKVSREGVRVVHSPLHSPVGSPGQGPGAGDFNAMTGAAPYGVRESREAIRRRGRSGTGTRGKAPRIRITFDDKEEDGGAWPRWI